MPIYSSHLRPKEERQSKAIYDGKRVKCKDYEYVEDIINQIVVDIVNGVQKSDIYYKLENQLYDDQRQKYRPKTAEMYYFTAMARIKSDKEEEIEGLKAKLYSQYYQLYQDAMKDGNTIVAKQVLDSIAKIFVGDTKNVNVSGNLNEKVSVSFGFENEKEE